MNVLQGQVDSLAGPLEQDTISQSLVTLSDTIPSGVDSLAARPGLSTDSLSMPSFDNSILDSINSAFNPMPDGEGFDFNKEQQQGSGEKEGGVESGSKDSSRTDIVGQKLHLYGEAYVKFEGFEVKADYIVFDLANNIVEASARPFVNVRPTFKNGDQLVEADRIKYDIDSEKGIVHGARIQQDQFYIHGAVTKFVRAGSDSLHIDDVIYNRNALVTTCDKDHPHWGIRTTKLKFIPEKLAVIGPFDMELGGVPTPFALPFAFAPLFNFERSTAGFIFPQDPFITSPRLGVGFRGLGYYLPISERLDLSLSADLYTRGNFALNAVTRYKKRYKYSGQVELRYSREFMDLDDQLTPLSERAYSFTISHRQDAKAHPYRTIGGRLSFSINDFNRRNYADVNAQLNSQTNSNFSYSYKLNNKTNFSTSVTHSQNTQTGNISFTLPEVQLRVSRIFPFKKKNSNSSNEAWFEKINMQYNGRFQNRVSTVDSLLFTEQTLKDFRSGVSHELDIGASYNLLNYFSFNTSASYDEYWYFQTYKDTIDNAASGVVSGGKVIPDFRPLRDLSVNANISTKIFGTLQFAKGKLRGLRHVMTPTVGLSYSPSNEDLYEEVWVSPFVTQPERYNPFSAEEGETLIFNRSLRQGGMRMTFRLENTFEGKTWSKRDSTEKKFKIFNSVNFNGSYNLQADSLQWSLISFTANAKLFKGKSTLSISGRFDPYIENDRGTRVNTTVLEAQGKLLRLDGFTASLSTSLSLDDIKNLFTGTLEDEDNPGGFSGGQNGSSGANSNELPEFYTWFKNFRFTHILRLGLGTGLDGGIETNAHSLQLTTGSIPLSNKWSMSINQIAYDFKRKELVYPSFSIARDLHCWQLNLNWQPQLDTYSFSIGVKASPFNQYLKYSTGRNTFDGLTRFN